MDCLTLMEENVRLRDCVRMLMARIRGDVGRWREITEDDLEAALEAARWRKEQGNAPIERRA